MCYMSSEKLTLGKYYLFMQKHIGPIMRIVLKKKVTIDHFCKNAGFTGPPFP